MKCVFYTGFTICNVANYINKLLKLLWPIYKSPTSNINPKRWHSPFERPCHPAVIFVCCCLGAENHRF